MGIAVAARQAPSRGQPVPPPEAKGGSRLPKKCHHLPTQCRACGTAMAITYPHSVTFWKFACAACGKPYSIEIVGSRQCLVYEQLGRKVVERIGLTQERSTYYRAKCYGCNTPVIVSQEEVGKVRSCHHCRLDFTVQEMENEVFYETVIQHQGAPVTFRDKVQVLEGYILNRGNMFFLDEDIVGRAQQEWVEIVSQLENELAVLRGEDGSGQSMLLRLQAEKNSLGQKLKQQMEKAVEMAGRQRALEERARSLEAEKQAYAERLRHYDDVVHTLDQKTEVVARLEGRVEALNRAVRELNSEKQLLLDKLAGQAGLLQAWEQEKAKQGEWLDAGKLADYKKLQKENKILAEKINSYNELLRDLDRQTERAAKFESMLMEAQAKVKKLTGENHQLANRLSGQGELLRDLERQGEKVAQLEFLNRELNKKIRGLQEAAQSGGGSAAADKGVLQQWEQEKKRAAELDVAYRETLRKLELAAGENRSLSSRLNEREGRLTLLEKQVQQAGKAAPEVASLETRLRTLQQENKKLESRLQEQIRLEGRVIELESEVSLLRNRGGERPEPKEDWYCEEGEEGSIPAQGKGFQERRILGIKGEPTPERIKAALRKRIRKYHPDMVASMGLELRELAHRKTQEITRAYSQLMSTCGRG
ncbi:MAG: hypothetical protein H7836_09305 [Magnetococcus sp. YQC-3]